MADLLVAAPAAELARAPLPPPALSPTERRLQAEWHLLQDLGGANPLRLADSVAEDMTFTVTLLATPALTLDEAIVTSHRVRVEFPRYFPSVPLELYLERPVLHPNVHPETGFVCLWDTHRSQHNIEHALLKLTAMLGWQLLNLDPRHVMQSHTAALTEDTRTQLAARLAAEPLAGLDHSAWQVTTVAEMPRRRRLS